MGNNPTEVGRRVQALLASPSMHTVFENEGYRSLLQKTELWKTLQADRHPDAPALRVASVCMAIALWGDPEFNARDRTKMVLRVVTDTYMQIHGEPLGTEATAHLQELEELLSPPQTVSHIEGLGETCAHLVNAPITTALEVARVEINSAALEQLRTGAVRRCAERIEMSPTSAGRCQRATELMRSMTSWLREQGVPAAERETANNQYRADVWPLLTGVIPG